MDSIVHSENNMAAKVFMDNTMITTEVSTRAKVMAEVASTAISKLYHVISQLNCTAEIAVVYTTVNVIVCVAAITPAKPSHATGLKGGKAPLAIFNVSTQLLLMLSWTFVD